MGKFVSKNPQGIVYFDVFNKNTFKEVEDLDKYLTFYSFQPDTIQKNTEIFYDTPARLLEKAGILLSKVIEKDKAYFKVERENYLPTNSLIKLKEEKIFVHEIGANDKIIDHTYYIIDGITSLFSTNFNLDFQNVLKTVAPVLEIVSKVKIIKVFSGDGFKCEMGCEEVFIKNNQTKRSANTFMMKVQNLSTAIYLQSFNEFIAKLEKYCKKLILIKDTKRQVALRMTRSK